MNAEGRDRLHAFVDGQLSAADKARLLEEMERDPALRQEVCDLHRVKEYVSCAFDDVPVAPSAKRSARPWRPIGRGIAALLLLGFGFLAGRWSDPAATPPAPPTQHVILHVNVSDPAKFLAVLADAEQIASVNAQAIQVEVVANGGGLDLMRNDRSPVVPQVRELMRRHHNLQFIACNISINKQLELGERPVLIDGVQVAPSAGDYILRRMEEGWSYVRI